MKKPLPLLFLCGSGIDSEGTSQGLFEGVESNNIGINMQETRVTILKGIAYLNI